jgi:hypothetical protein
MASMERMLSPRGPAAAIASTATRLARDFGAKSAITRNALDALCEPLRLTGQSPAAAAMEQWRLLQSQTGGRPFEQPAARLQQLAARYGLDAQGLPPDALLFALQTWYLLAVKLLVAEVTAAAAGLPSVAKAVCRAAGENRLRAAIEALEQGPLADHLRPDGPPGQDPYCWYLASWSANIGQALLAAATQLAEYPREAILQIPADGHDLFKHLYEELFPRTLRHALGEYYTPNWLAAHVLDRVGYGADGYGRLLDPTCGSGVFLVMAIRRLRAALAGGPELCRQILHNVVGLDLNPLAAMTARANYLLAIADLLTGAGPIQIPVYQRDAILDAPLGQRPFDFVVGNPPWIAWDNLPDQYREATKPLWERYGLFSLSANQARHGGGKKDLSMLVLYAAADRYLKPGGRLGMVITQTLFQSKGAGDGFRRFRLGPDGDWLNVLRVDDMVALKPFRGAANWTSTIVLEKGTPTTYPVPYVKWTPGCDGTPQQRNCWARPVEAQRPGSPWLVEASQTSGGGGQIGPSDYTAHLGANSGGANAVYWLQLVGKDADGVIVRNLAAKAKRGVPAVQQRIEPELLYPLLRWGDVRRWSAIPSAYILMAQDVHTRYGIDEDAMRGSYPLTYAYLKQFEDMLARRAAYRRYQGRKPFYSMYNVGTYTVSPVKVIWRRMDRQISAAVVEPIDDPLLGRRPLVPQETCVLIACATTDEAHYLCAALNSDWVNSLVAAHSVAGGKGFGTPGIMEVINLRRYDAANPRHTALAALSRQAHQLAALPDAAARGQSESAAISGDIDRIAAELFSNGGREV